VASFRGWSDRLRLAEVGFAELPGRGSRLREPAVASLAAAVHGLVDAIVRGRVAPTALFGHGLGAVIAFEAARDLQARSWPLLALFVSGRGAPSLPPTGPALSSLPLEQLQKEARRRSDVIALDDALDKDSIELLVPGVRADFEMLDRYVYQPGPPLRCPIVACGAAADPDVPRNDLSGWRAETSARFSVHILAADASYLQREHEALTALVANQLSVMASALVRASLVR
jgi:medium-chain acyl-[acyl-carrier-protein] hydrolase